MEYLKRSTDDGAARAASVADTVADIVRAVRERGDEAVLEYTAKFDGVERKTVRPTDAEREAALAELDDGAREILEHNHERIREFAERQRDSVEDFEAEFGDGVRLGQRWNRSNPSGRMSQGGATRCCRPC